MGKKRTAKQSHKRPTLAQQNMELKAKLEALIKERDKLSEQLCNEVTDDHGITKLFNTKLNDIIRIAKEVNLQLAKQIILEIQKREQTMKLLRDILNDVRENLYSNTCTVCFSQTTRFGEHRLVSLPCGHLYGENCIRHWLRQQPFCPQCRQPSRLNQLRQLLFPIW